MEKNKTNKTHSTSLNSGRVNADRVNSIVTINFRDWKIWGRQRTILIWFYTIRDFHAKLVFFEEEKWRRCLDLLWIEWKLLKMNENDESSNFKPLLTDFMFYHVFSCNIRTLMQRRSEKSFQNSYIQSF